MQVSLIVPSDPSSDPVRGSQTRGSKSCSLSTVEIGWGGNSSSVGCSSDNLMLLVREPILYTARGVMLVSVVCFFGVIYIDSRQQTQPMVMQRLFLLFWCVAEKSYPRPRGLTRGGQAQRPDNAI